MPYAAARSASPPTGRSTAVWADASEGQASSTAAVRGQELLVVNVDVDTGERLRRAGLSATTYIAPEAPTDL